MRQFERWHALAFALAVLLFIGANLLGVTGGYSGDDRFYLLDNRTLKSLSFTELWKLIPYSAEYNQIDWGPLRDMVYKAMFAVFGEKPLPFKLLNYFLYVWLAWAAYRAANTTLKVFDDTDGEHAATAALIASVLFVLHPTHVESLQAIWGLKDLLMAGFSLSAVPYFMRWVESRSVKAALAGSVLLACAGLSKGVSVALLAPLWLLAYAAQKEGGVAAKAWSATRLLLPVAIFPLIVFTAFVVASPLQEYIGADARNWTDRPLIILGGQTLIALLPYPLSRVYAPYGAFMPLYLGLGVLALAVSAWGAWAFAKKPAAVSYGLLFFATMLLPYLQIAPFQTNSMIADRFGFVALFGLCVAAGAGAMRLPLRRSMLAVSLLAAGLLVVTGLRAPGWRNPQLLFAEDASRTQAEPSKRNYQVIESSLENARSMLVQAQQMHRMTMAEADDIVAYLGQAQIALAAPRPRTSDIAALQFYPKAERLIGKIYRTMWNTYGPHPLLAADASTHFLRNEEYQEAQGWAELAIRSPNTPAQRLAVAYKNLGIALMKQGDIAGAVDPLYRSLDLQPAGNYAACVLKSLARDYPAVAGRNPQLDALCPNG